MEADPSLLKQVFLNLIRNASDACGNEGKLRILTEERKAAVVIRFVDNGPGFPDEILDRVMEPFFSTRETGIGLGLAVTERIIEAHGGQVNLENAPDGGAVVVLQIPY
jgi:two-component system NtrC family sensor kinase